ncbi:hypothetical protein BGX27_006725 [Mortierella sp. AM989]|nr:hypothetical protein BGX27_006725 [Mortierella sp. AM989]
MSVPEFGTVTESGVPESDPPETFMRSIRVARPSTRSAIHFHHAHSKQPDHTGHATSSFSGSSSHASNPDMVHAATSGNNNNTTSTTATNVVSLPSSSSSSFSSRYGQESFSSIHKQNISQSTCTQPEQDHEMDIISALGIADRPYQSSYDFFNGSSSTDNNTPTSPLSSIPQPHHIPHHHQLLTKQDSTNLIICSSKSHQQGEYETRMSTAVGSDFRGHASSKRAPSYELKGNEQRSQDEDDQEFMDSWDENTLRLEGCGDSILDEEMEQLSPIPFSELPSLTNIGLCSHGIVKLSSNIRLLASATCVQICCNELSRIPAEIGFLRNLTLLDLSKNNLSSLPETITYLTKLVDLKLSFNQLEHIPAGIGGLTKLAALALDNNKLVSIPPQIGLIKGLVNLDLSDNPITVLPAEVGKLQFLRRLKLDRCPLVVEFSHSPLHSPPTLLELAARVIVRHDVTVPSTIVPHLKDYIQSAETCSFCDGPYFDSWVKRGKLIEKNEALIPLEYTLCQPHWNTEQERIKLLFCKQPITSPPTKPAKPSVSQQQQSKAESSGVSQSSGPSSANNNSIPKRPLNRKFASENGARERPLAKSRFSFLRNAKGGERPTSTYRTISLPIVTSTTITSPSSSTSSPSPLSTSVFSSTASASTTTSASVSASNLANQNPTRQLEEPDNNNNISINNTRPTVRRSLTASILARATSKLKRPLSMGPTTLEPAVMTIGLAPTTTGAAPAE